MSHFCQLIDPDIHPTVESVGGRLDQRQMMGVGKWFFNEIKSQKVYMSYQLFLLYLVLLRNHDVYRTLTVQGVWCILLPA